MSDEQSFFRGDIIVVSLPLVTDPTKSKIRPAVIIQNDVGNRYSPNLIIAAISSQIPQREYPMNVIIQSGSSRAEGTGLDRDSVIQAEIILTIPKTSVIRKIGCCNASTMRVVDQSVKISLGLA